MFLKNLSIKHKILIIPAVSTFGFIIFLLYIVDSGSKNGQRLQEIRDVYFPVLNMASSNIVILERMDESMAIAATTGEEDMLDRARKMSEQMLANFSQQQKLQPEHASTIANVQAALDDYIKLSFKLTQEMIDGTVDFSLMAESAEKKKKALNSVKSQLTEFKDSSHKRFLELVNEANETEKSNMQAGIIIALLTVAVILIIAFSVALLVVRSVEEISTSLKDIAQGEGDLTRRIKETGKDELGELVKWFNVFVEKLNKTIGEVIHVIAPLSEVATDLTRISSETSNVMGEQSRSSDMMSSSMDDMLRSVNEVAENAGSAASAASDADGEAKDGRDIVQETVITINGLASAVEQSAEVITKLETDAASVGGILDVIKVISEQTNLLALNAAIEAARAGEQGRGFAVVADEVRTLASRTQDSTREIQTLIERLQNAAQSAVNVMEESKEKAKLSVTQASKTDSSLEEIAVRVTSITEMNQQIATATEEQQTFVGAIRENVEAMSEASSVAKNSTEKVSDLSGSLEGLADQLQNVASQFKV